MSQRDDAAGVLAQTIHLPTGITLSIPALPYQSGILLKFISGGSLAILGTTYSLVSENFGGGSYVVALQYPVLPGEAVAFNATGAFNIQAFGATGVLALTRTFDSVP